MTDEEIEKRFASIALELKRLAGEQKSQKRVSQQQGELLETIASPPWKRFWFFIQGYRLWRVGRWWGKTEDLK